MTIRIPLTQGFFTIVDDEDAALADQKWFANRYPDGHVYAVRNKPMPARGLLRMHRVITGAPDGLEVDHINGDTLDNRRSNLRVVTRAQNAQNLAIRTDNTSGHRGVRFYSGVWQACVQRDGAIVYCERFLTEDEAVTAVRLARRKFLPFDAQGVVGVQDQPWPTPLSSRRRRTHCYRGHPLSGDNLKLEAGGVRQCLKCRMASYRQKAERERSQAMTRAAW